MKRLLKVTAMTGLLTLLRMAMGFVIAKVVAVYTGPAGMAMLGQVQSMVTSLNGIINAPVGSGIVRYTAEKKEEGFEACAPWWRASLQWVLIISTIIIPVGLLLADHIAIWLFQDTTLTWIVMVTVAVLPLSAIGTLCISVVNGQQQYRRYVGLGMLSVLISGTVMLTMIVQANIKGALLATAVQAALIGVIMLAANLRRDRWLYADGHHHCIDGSDITDLGQKYSDRPSWLGSCWSVAGGMENIRGLPWRDHHGVGYLLFTASFIIGGP